MTDAPLSATRLLATLTSTEPKLRAIANADSAVPPAPGKWSPRQVIGHLIDSASNNHQRFVRARWKDDLVFDGYEQDGWVELQNYQGADWNELITLWVSFNRHIARVMCAVPAEVRLRVSTRHNFDQIAAWPPTDGALPTLDYFMLDYVDHLEHHLRQILGDSL